MCGLVGVLGSNAYRADSGLIHKMTETLVHRGPDGDGVYTDGPVGLGHRRLAILDLSSAAAQPMRSADGRYIIVYNGEVYNFKELRNELKTNGRTFRSQSDTEVLLEGFSHWGERILDRLNGMFAFAIWDTKTRELWLARDRYGIKPLYYCWVDNVLLFASEIKAFLAYPSFQVQLDREALLEYLTFQNYLNDGTLFKGVRLLAAGTSVRVKATDATTPEFHRYWDYSFEEPEKPKSDEEYLEELDHLFGQAVERQLVSDVSVSSFLSGGVDSGAITAVASQNLPGMRSFTVGFDLRSASGLELAYDEREAAEHMSYLFGTEHYEMVLKAGDMERAMKSLVWHLEEPRVGQSYPNFYASKLASRFDKVVMSGTGGDEIYGGYPWRYYRAVDGDDFEHYVEQYYAYWQRLIPNSEIRKIFDPIWDDVQGVRTRDIFHNVFTKHADRLSRPEDYINHSLYFEAKTFLHGLLVMEDKLSMAHGLETRVPFLDNDLVDFSMRIPTRLKLGNLGKVQRIDENEVGDKGRRYYQNNRDGKLILRKVMERYVPNGTANAAKQGFSAPDASWFRGESIDYVRDTICTNNALIYDWIDRDAVMSLVNEHLDGRKNRRLLVWSLLSLEQWCQTFLQNDGSPLAQKH